MEVLGRKTFTLFGGKGTTFDTIIDRKQVTITEQEGIISLCIKYFRQYQQKNDKISHLTVSAVEMYGKTKTSAKMQLFDLYDPHNLSPTLDSKPINGRFTFDKLSKRFIEKHSIQHILNTAQKAAHTIKIKDNECSNRGSVVFVLEIHFMDENSSKIVFVDPPSNEIKLKQGMKKEEIRLRKGENMAIKKELSQYKLLLMNMEHGGDNVIDNVKRSSFGTHGITNVICQFLKENKTNFPKHLKLYTISTSITHKKTTESTLVTAFMVKEGFSSVWYLSRTRRRSI